MALRSKTLFFLWALCLLTSSFSARAEVDLTSVPLKTPRLGDFLPIDKDFAAAISTAAGITVEPGLYLSDVRSSLLLETLRPPRFTAVLTHSARYLFEDPQIELLYGKKVWQYRGAKEISQPSGEEVKIVPADESLMEVGWVADPPPSAARSLWVVRPNGEAWRLYTELKSEEAKAQKKVTEKKTENEKGDGGRDGEGKWNRLFSFLPARIIPTARGVFALTADGQAHWKPYEGEVVSNFSITDFDGNTKSEPLTVSSQDGKFHIFPHPSLPKVLIACLEGPTSSFRSVYLMDLDTGAVDHLLRSVPSPISFQPNGIFYSRFGTAVVRTLDAHWSVASLSESSTSPTSADAPHEVSDSPSRTPIAPELASALGKIAGASDILNQVRTGRWRPIYSAPSFTDRLNQILGRADRNTLALVPYNEGALPQEAVAAYFQQIDIPTLMVPVALEQLDHAFLIKPGRWMEGASLRPAMEVFRSVSQHPKTVLVFQDFPSPLIAGGQKPTPEMVVEMASRLEAFLDVFGVLIETGKARIVLLVRKEIIDAMAVTHAHLFQRAAIAEIPAIPPSMRKIAARNLMVRSEGEFPHVRFSEGAFESIYETMEEQLADPKNSLQAPGLMDGYILGLSSKVSQNIRSKDSREEITREAAIAYKATALRRWKLVAVFDPEDETKKILLWTHPDEAPRNVDPRIIEAWREDSSRLTYMERLPFAVIALPAKEASPSATRIGLTSGQVLLFQPEHPMNLQALSFIPKSRSLHSRGFYFIYSDSKEASLGSFRIGEIEPVIILKAGLHPDDLADEKVKLHFERDLVTLSLSGLATTYDADGNEVENP